jgi:hypothetical protein
VAILENGRGVEKGIKKLGGYIKGSELSQGNVYNKGTTIKGDKGNNGGSC